jgi:predicted amidophosphoribosyltransferase
LAKEIGKLIGTPVMRVLVKQRKTKPQASLTKAERLTNLRGSIALTKPISLSGKTIVLVDDVMTTGSTLQECARVLRKSGAKRVIALVLAHGK